MSDENIRNLERKAKASLAKDDILAYWVACLRVGLIPLPTTRYVSIGTFDVWTLHPREYVDYTYRFIGSPIKRILKSIDPKATAIYLNIPDAYGSNDTVLPSLKIALEKLIEYEQTH